MKEKIFKERIKKRLFSAILALAMILTIFPMNSMKAYAWTVSNVNISEIEYDGESIKSMKIAYSYPYDSKYWPWCYCWVGIQEEPGNKAGVVKSDYATQHKKTKNETFNDTSANSLRNTLKLVAFNVGDGIKSFGNDTDVSATVTMPTGTKLQPGKTYYLYIWTHRDGGWCDSQSCPNRYENSDIYIDAYLGEISIGVDGYITFKYPNGDESGFGEHKNHSFEYSDSGTQLVAKCKGTEGGCTFSNCGHNTEATALKLTLNASSPTCGSNPIEPTITFGNEQEQKDWTDVRLKLPGSDGGPAVEKKYYSTDNNGDKAGELPGAPTAVGKYFVDVTIDGQVTVSVPFVIIPAAPEGLEAKAPKYIGGKDGKITGVDDTMEYSTDGGENWESVPEGQTEITGLSAGKVKVRVAAKDPIPAGVEKELIISNGPQNDPAKTPLDKLIPEGPQYVDDPGKITGVDDTMEYSIDGGVWIELQPGQTEITDLPEGAVVKVRIKGELGEERQVIIPEGKVAKELKNVSVNKNLATSTYDVTNLNPTTMVYSIDGGEWTELQSGQTQITDLPEGTVLKVRVIGSDDDSKILVLELGTKRKPSSGGGCSNGQHQYEWGNWDPVTKDENGIRVYQCKLCGYLLEKEYIPAYAYTCLTESEHVLKTPQNGSVICEMGRWNAYPRWFFEKLATRPDVNITLKFLYQHKQYTVYIPAGTKIDTELDWYGPLKICSLYQFEVK